MPGHSIQPVLFFKAERVQGKNNFMVIFIAGKSDSFGNFPIFSDSFPESSPILEESGKVESYPIFLENLKVWFIVVLLDVTG